MGFCLLACSPDDAPGWRKLQNTKVMYGIKKIKLNAIFHVSDELECDSYFLTAGYHVIA